MSVLTRLRDRLRKNRAGRKLGESDAPADTGAAQTRATGGTPQPGAPDAHSTTGSTPSGTFVGRAGGDDPGSAGQTGAEARAAEARAAETRRDDADSDPGS
jgi:hypothetical protein